ncbi:MAG: RNA-protein complex protein Nop10 [Thermoplasmata archaeon]
MTDSLLHVCRACGRYTFRTHCPQCSAPTRTPHPARFDATDRYGKYRRLLVATDASPTRTG